MEYQSTARAQVRPSSMLVAATVQASEDNAVLVAGSFGLVRAMVADSCLLAPAIHDTVLVALLDDGSAWLVQVLRRTQDTASLRVPPKTTLHAENLTIASTTLDLTAERVSITGRLVHLAGALFLASFHAISFVAKRLQEALTQRVCRTESLDEEVAGLAHRKAKRARLTVATGYRVRAEYADLRAKTTIDIDANHIKVG